MEAKIGGKGLDGLWFYSPSRQPEHMHPLVLAYIGDTIYDLYIRQYVISHNNHRSDHLHRLATRYVSAKAQAGSLRAIHDRLTEEEREVVKRGRNAKSGSVPKNTDVIEYRQSTAFECLLGYLYYCQRHDRLKQIMDMTVKEDA